MLSFIYNWFWKPSDVPVFKMQNNSTLIYDFRKNKKEYIDKCSTIITKMKVAGLLQDLMMVSNPDTIASKYDKDFRDFDMEHVNYFRPLLSSIMLSQDIEYTDINAKMITKLVCKHYLIKPKPMNSKVSCAVYVNDENTKIQVNCYDIDKQGVHYFKDPKGSIERNECVGDALLREMKEELGFEFPLSRYTLMKQSNTMTNFSIMLSKDDYDNYIKNLNTKNIDVEITHIALVKN